MTPDRGPWKIVDHDHVGSDDFTHDVWLKVSGDFSDDPELAARFARLTISVNGRKTGSGAE